MIISPEVLTILILNGLMVLFASISLIFALRLALYWGYRFPKKGGIIIGFRKRRRAI